MDGRLDAAATDRWALLLATTHLVRAHGPAVAAARLRAVTRRTGWPDVGPSTVGRGHETVLAFTVWAVDRLLAAGLTTTQVLWHPLTGPGSVLAWYPAEVLASDEAHDGFVPSPLALRGEPAPHPLPDRRPDRAA